MVQTVPSAFRVAMNCTSDLMNPTSIVPANSRAVPQSKGISVAGDRIVIGQTTGAVEFVALNGRTAMRLAAGLQQSQTIRLRDLGLTPGSYLVSLRGTNGSLSTTRFLVK
jgi:hypothetical protein